LGKATARQFFDALEVSFLQTYKPPSSQDCPEDFRTYLYKGNQANQTGIFGSKATGEPPFLMAYAAHLALRNAVNAAKFGSSPAQWYRFDGPAMNANVQALTEVTSDDFFV